LLLFAWSERPVRLSLIVEDSAGNQSAKQFSLRQGANHLQVAFAEFQGFDMTKVSSLLLRTADSASLYLDYIALDQYQKVFDTKGRWDVDYTNAIVTPHFPWAADFANGKIKALLNYPSGWRWIIRPRRSDVPQALTAGDLAISTIAAIRWGMTATTLIV